MTYYKKNQHYISDFKALKTEIPREPLKMSRRIFKYSMTPKDVKFRGSFGVRVLSNFSY